MKKVIFLTVLSVAFVNFCSAQRTPVFTAEEQEKVKTILGKDFVPVFSSKGELAIATERSVKDVKALPQGGFRNPGTSVASNILIHKGWILATSKEIMDAMRSKLGRERFAQLEKVMETKR